jgi:hypothetical protein
MNETKKNENILNEYNAQTEQSDKHEYNVYGVDGYSDSCAC